MWHCFSIDFWVIYKKIIYQNNNQKFLKGYNFYCEGSILQGEMIKKQQNYLNHLNEILI